MNMVYCRGCAATIHATAPTCPSCGAKQMMNDISPTPGWVLFIICFFFGWFGAHRFAIGQIGLGILMLLTFGGLGIWWFIDHILILASALTDSKGRKVTLTGKD